MSTTVTYKGSTLTTVENATKKLTTQGTWLEDDITITDSPPSPNLQSKSATPTESTQTIAADSGYDGLSSVEVGAISSTYVGSGVPRKTTTTYHPSLMDQTISSGQYLTGDQIINGVLTTGLYDGNIRYGKTVKVGDASDDDCVTSVTGIFTDAGSVSYGQQAASSSEILDGYSAFIDGAEVRGNIQHKSSADLTVSGATVTAPAGYYQSSATKTVSSGTEGTPTATKGAVSNHSVSVTPSVTNTGGYISGGTKTGTAVTVQASELVSGSETKNANGTYDVTNLASLVVAIPIVTYYTGSSAPSSSLGSNGDIYLQTS